MAEKRPTILQIIPELDTGGAERTTVEVAGAIVKAGGRAIVLAQGGCLCTEVEAAGAELIRFPAATKNPLRILANAYALSRLIQKEAVDIVHARSRAPAWSALIAARRTRTHFVTTYHGIYREKGPAKRAYNAVMAKGDIVIANSNYTARLVEQRYGTDPSRIIVINRGVDLEHFDRAKISDARLDALRTAWALTPQHRVILHAARLTRWKGQTVVIDAAAELFKRPGYKNVMVLLAGSAQGRDSYQSELAEQIADNGLSGRVVMSGHVTDMPAALALSELVLIASIEPEAFGRTSVEAQAMGVPVIATSIGAPPDTVLAPPDHPASAATGRHVPPSDPARLADAMAELLMLPADAREAMASRAIEHARSNFSTTTLQLATLGVYDRLIGSNLAARFGASNAGNAVE